MDDLSAAAYLIMSAGKHTQHGYPCEWCGMVTTHLDAEGFHVCLVHQREYATTDFDDMRRNYPLHGKDERNPAFFRAQHQRRVSRARSLSSRELRLIIKRGAKWDKDYAGEMLQGIPLDRTGMEYLGGSAEQYVDNWP